MNERLRKNVLCFFERVSNRAIDGLPDEIKRPDGNSKGKNGMAPFGKEDDGITPLCYHLWYKGYPGWENWRSLCYEVEMRFDDPSEVASCSNAYVAIRYGENKYGQIGGLSDGKSKSLKSFVNNLDIHEGQRLRQRNSWGRVEVNFGSNTLNDEFRRRFGGYTQAFH